MVPSSVLFLFISTLFVLYAMPGPDMLLLLQTSVSRGARHGFATELGLALARAAHVILSACGVAALLRSAPWLYQGVRVMGALYLAYVALHILRAPALCLETATGSATRGSLRSTMMRGLLSSLLNPKALLFCSVLLPQFVRVEAGSIGWQMLELGVLTVAMGVLFDIVLVLGAARVSGWLRARPRAQAVQRRTFSGLLLVFAAYFLMS
jgi:threonine/homoserine/homoserine lactone efflux protein